MHLKILSYNWHEPYLCLLSKVGHTFLIIEPEISEGNYRRWDKNMRPVNRNELDPDVNPDDVCTSYVELCISEIKKEFPSLGIICDIAFTIIFIIF